MKKPDKNISEELSSIDFDNRVGILYGDDLDALGIEPTSIIGTYRCLESVENICDKHSNFHIVTMTPTHCVNRPIPGMKGYFLANGDRNPELSCKIPIPTPADWGVTLKSFISKVGPNPPEWEDQLTIRYLRQLAGGDDIFDVQTAQSALKNLHDQ